jgi:hypothetical protein
MKVYNMYKFTSILLVMVLNANINVNALNEAKFDGMSSQ